jgi:hypothetical protein
VVKLKRMVLNTLGVYWNWRLHVNYVKDKGARVLIWGGGGHDSIDASVIAGNYFGGEMRAWIYENAQNISLNVCSSLKSKHCASEILVRTGNISFEGSRTKLREQRAEACSSCSCWGSWFKIDCSEGCNAP